MVRVGVIGPSVPTYYDAWYAAAFTLFALTIWLPLVEKARQTIHFG